MASESSTSAITPISYADYFAEKVKTKSVMLTESFKAHIAEWVKAFSPDRSRKEVIDEFNELMWAYIHTNNLHGYEPDELVHVDRLIGFELDDGVQPIKEYVGDDGNMPMPGSYFQVDESRWRAPCFEYGGKEELAWYLVVQKGLFTCKVERVSDWDLEANFATQMLVRHGEDVMRRKFFSVFEPTFQLLTWLDSCVMGSRLHGDTEQGWSGKYSRHNYSGDAGKLHQCTDRENTYYIIHRVAVFTCDVEFFATKADGDAVVAWITEGGGGGAP